MFFRKKSKGSRRRTRGTGAGNDSEDAGSSNSGTGGARMDRLTSTASLPGSGYGFINRSDLEEGVKDSDLDVAMRDHLIEAEIMAEKLHKRAHKLDEEDHPTADLENMVLETYGLAGCYYIGHTNTDLDSVSSAIAGADLFGGFAARSEREVNGEIEFALEYAGLELPPYFDDIEGANDPYNTKNGIVLVDHNSPAQSIASIGQVAFPKNNPSSEDLDKAHHMAARIKGVIDHHALAESFHTGHPLFMDIRPWGSACTILAHQYVRLARPIPEKVAIVLLCGILSDTINLTSPTTTHADKVFATLLALMGGEKTKHPNQLAEKMFHAKTAHFYKLTAYAVVRADQKGFDMGDYSVAWATIEVNDHEPILKKSRKLLLEMRVLKQEKSYDLCFLSVVNLQEKRSYLLLCGEYEVAVAKQAFGGETSNALDWAPAEEEDESCAHNHGSSSGHDHGHDHHLTDNSAKGLEELNHVIHLNPEESLMDIGNRVSRKKEFIPPVKKVISGGWKPSRQSVRIQKLELAPHTHTEHACVDV